MTLRGFLVLLVLTLASLAGAGWALLSRDEPVASVQLDIPFLPDLAGKVDRVAKIEVTTGEGKTVTIVRTADGWVVEELGGFPAEPDRVREIVLGLAEMRLIEPKTHDPGKLHRLGLDPERGEDRPKTVRLYDDQGKLLAEAMLGKRRWSLYGPGRSGMYVRLPGDEQAWLADRAVDLPNEPLNVVDRNLVFLPRDDIREVRLHAGTPQEVVITREAPKEPFRLEGLGPDEVADEAKLNRVVAALGTMSAEEIRTRGEKPVPADAARAVYRLFDGLVLEVAVWKEGEGDDAQYWVAPEARVEQPAAPAPAADAGSAQAPAAGEGSQAKDASPQATEGAEAKKPAPERAAELNRRWQRWVFRVSDFLGERLLWTREDLLEKPAG